MTIYFVSKQFLLGFLRFCKLSVRNSNSHMKRMHVLTEEHKHHGGALLKTAPRLYSQFVFPRTFVVYACVDPRVKCTDKVVAVSVQLSLRNTDCTYT